MEIIQENVNVFLQKGKVLKAFKLQKGKKIVFEKLHFIPDKAFGHPYNTYFRVASNELEKIENEPAPDKEGKDNDKESAEDNRMLVDSHGKSQSLCREEIVNMKSSGAAGEDIVNEIVKNSATFTSKTSYSQKKYLKKKRNKHLTSVRILKPSARLLCKMYESREPAKICQMRLNTFSQILTMGNIHHDSKVVVVENCSGVLLSIIMERLSGSGCIVNLHTGVTPTNFHAASLMNFPDSWWKTLHSLPLCKIGPLLANKDFKDVVGDISIYEKEIPDNGVTVTSDGSDKLDFLKKKSKRDGQVTEEEKGQIRSERKRKRLYHQKSAWDALKARNMDALVLACRYHPSPIFLCLFEVLGPAKPFIVHCENQEPLMELFCQLLASGKAVNLKISETFTRQYQVLPEQTHPMVTMNTTGGYLLSGIKVDTESNHCKPSPGGILKSDDAPPSKRTKSQ